MWAVADGALRERAISANSTPSRCSRRFTTRRGSPRWRWRQEAPAGFEFAIKCFQLVTHPATSPTYRRLRRTAPPAAAVGGFRDTPEVRAGWEETVAAADALGARIVLLQTPAQQGHCRPAGQLFPEAASRGAWLS